jgi:hypothetical protein
VNHLRKQFPVWGTIVDVDCYSQSVGGADLDRAMETVIEFCENGDRDFSTYKDGSWVSRLRRGEVAIGDCPDDVREVWELCLRAKDLSDGAFDPWAVAGGFDPSGLVKGWAADLCADILVAAGVGHVQVNAAGDLALRGGWFDSVAGVVKRRVVDTSSTTKKWEKEQQGLNKELQRQREQQLKADNLKKYEINNNIEAENLKMRKAKTLVRVGVILTKSEFEQRIGYIEQEDL